MTRANELRTIEYEKKLYNTERSAAWKIKHEN